MHSSHHESGGAEGQWVAYQERFWLNESRQKEDLPPSCSAEPSSIHLAHISQTNDADGEVVRDHLFNSHS